MKKTKKTNKHKHKKSNTEIKQKQKQNKTKTNKQTKQAYRVILCYFPVIIHKDIEELEFVSELYGY